jgi:hypothetical protein
LTQTVRLGADDAFATFEFTVGAIPIFGAAETEAQLEGTPPVGKRGRRHRRGPPKNVGQGKEVVSRFTTSIRSKGELLTDSNGREMLRRQRNVRPTWKLNQTEEVAGNYFPCNAAAAIRDDTAQLTVLVDASQGVGSLADGQLELMVHRRLTHDDHRGVGEPLDETEFISSYISDGIHGEHSGPGLVIRGKHVVTLEPPTTAARVWRPLADRVYTEPLLMFERSSGRVGDALHRHQSKHGGAAAASSALSKALPSNVQLITLATLATSPPTLLLRLAHQFGVGEDAEMSEPVSVDIALLFNATTAFKVAGVTELSLTGNQEKSAIMAQRKQAGSWYRKESDHADASHPWRSAPPMQYGNDTTTTLGPLEIKTFALDILPAAMG